MDLLFFTIVTVCLDELTNINHHRKLGIKNKDLCFVGLLGLSQCSSIMYISLSLTLSLTDLSQNVMCALSFVVKGLNYIGNPKGEHQKYIT